MDNISDYVFPYLPFVLVSVGGAYWLYDKYLLAPKESRDTLSKIENIQISKVLNFEGGLLAFDFADQRVVVVKRKSSRILDVSEVRDGGVYWKNVSRNGELYEKDFYMLLQISDLEQPEMRFYFPSRKEAMVCFELFAQLRERRIATASEWEANSVSAERSITGYTGNVAVILTAIEAETRSVLSHLVESKEVSVAGTIFHNGEFITSKHKWMVAVAEVGPRNVSAGLAAERAIQFFKPKVAFFIGVAGGVKDVKLGDVVAATKIYAYESGKETQTGFVPRPELKLTSHLLEQRARSVRLKKNWLKRLKEPHPHEPCAFVEPIAAGDKLIGSSKSRTAALIKRHYSDAVAAEMEGHGFLSALHVNPSTHGMVIRGISDLFDGKAESDAAGWQILASDSASAFAFEMLTEIDFEQS